MPIHLPARDESSVPDRRAFLAGIAASATSLALGSVARAAARETAAPWYALVADVHIAADASNRTRGQNMADNLRAVVTDILHQDEPPLGVVIDGDLALKNGQSGDYRTLLTLLEPLRRQNLPLHLTLGNHDDRAHFRDVLRLEFPRDQAIVDRHVSVVDGPGVRLFMLDSLDKVDEVPGLLGDRQREWLARELDREPARPAILFVHHNLSTQAGALVDTEALLKLVTPRRQVKAIVFGHTHVWSHTEPEGLHRINLAAVAYPFEKDQPLGWCKLRPEPDGARIELRCVGGDQTKNGEQTRLRWRKA